jgi:hypothetical protein
MAMTRGVELTWTVPRLLRFGGAGFILLNGGVHLYLWDHAYRQIHVIGPLFVLNAVAALIIALALIWKPEGITTLLAMAFSAGTFMAFVLSLTIGLFGFTAGWDRNAVIAVVAEIGAIVLLGSWWVMTRRRRGARPMGERDEGGEVG